MTSRTRRDATAHGTRQDGHMADDPRRSITLTRAARGRYVATNPRGATLAFGEGEDELSPIELLLVAIAGCSAADVDYITNKRAEPTEFVVDMSADKVRDDDG